ncbi:MAG: hypothetical protein J7578_07775 [Chitinophagaceae bacterium]|nr:hypothetical protein [Chitinophagaceae bacterium]
MKNRSVSGIFLAIVAIIALAVGCHKGFIEEQPETPNPEPVALGPEFKTNCTDAPDYGSTLICFKWKGPKNDHIITPLNNPGDGKYIAWPQGLTIDSSTGAINVSKSETGARYMVGFIKNGTSDTCKTEIILGGITYVDNIYVMSENDTLAAPYFNASPVASPVCDANNNNPPTANDCEFDDGDDDDNGNGQSDEPPPGPRANDQHVKVRTNNGVINLKRSLEEGVFGPNPKNGASKEVAIYYRLNDCSNKALQKINIRLLYYEKRSDIPQNLSKDISARRNDFFLSRYISSPTAPRPPQIIIARLAE